MASELCSVYVELQDPYTEKLLLNSLAKYDDLVKIVKPANDENLEDLDFSKLSKTIFWLEYERLPFERLQHESKALLNVGDTSKINAVSCAYCIRKGLIRKAQMAMGLKMYSLKNAGTILTKTVPETWILELDHPEYLDEALQDCYEVEEIMANNQSILDRKSQEGEGDKEEDKEQLKKTTKLIIKPSLTGKGAGIHLFETMSDLTEILDAEFSDSDESETESTGGDDDSINDDSNDGDNNDDDDGSEEEKSDKDAEGDENIDWSKGYSSAVSQIREWVIQKYIDNPLLLESYGNRKFHIRVYCLAIGGITVYVYKEMLALFASKPYDTKFESPKDCFSHITNTYVQTGNESFDEDELVHLFWDLSGGDNSDTIDSARPPKAVSCVDLEFIYQQIKDTVKDLFDATTSQHTTFQAWQNCFEMFGLDFIVDDSLNVHFLEANAYPDFKQTGSRLSGLVSGFFDSVVSKVLETYIQPSVDLSNLLNTTDQSSLDLVLKKSVFGLLH